jgi:hypothetical protein
MRRGSLTVERERERGAKEEDCIQRKLRTEFVLDNEEIERGERSRIRMMN